MPGCHADRSRRDVTKVIGIRLDITERKEIERQIRVAGQHNPLTGLPNRALLFEYAEHVLATARRSGAPAAILFIDLDHFKEVNDTLGHDAGDTALRSVAERLRAAPRKGDMPGRLGGDEFLVILGEVKGEDGAAGVAEDVLARLSRPYRIADQELALLPSIGIALFPHDGTDLDTLVDHADRAMYEAKRTRGARIEFFTPHARTERRGGEGCRRAPSIGG